MATPDIVGSCRAHAFAIETKQPGERPEPIQVYRLQEWRDAGARVGVADNVEQARRIAKVLEVQTLDIIREHVEHRN